MAMAGNVSMDNKGPAREGSHDLVDLSLVAESDAALIQDNGVPQKRKGGRKPIYTTPKERKQRNRQAQADFRGRRTEYIKKLEESSRLYESKLHRELIVQQSVTNECLMLRYKNSLLELIILEKGIDFRADVYANIDGSYIGPSNMAQDVAQDMAHPTVQRAIMYKYHEATCSNLRIAPELEPGIGVQNSQYEPWQQKHPLVRAQAVPRSLDTSELINSGVIGNSIGLKKQGSSNIGGIGGIPEAPFGYHIE